MELIAALTIWILLSCFLLFPMLGLRPLFHRTAGTLLAAEGIALMMYGYGSEGCRERPCGTVAEVGNAAAGVDIPLLTVALVALATAHGIRIWRRAPTSSAPRVSASPGTGRRPGPSSARDTSDRGGSAPSCASSRADRSGRA